MAREIAEWYVMISGQRVGPMSRAEVGMQASSGAIDGQTHCWKSGMAGWKLGSDVPELSGLFGGESEEPPPPPPPSKKPSSAGKRAPQAGDVDKSASASRPGGNKPGALKPVMSVRSAGVPARERAGKLRSAYEANNDEVGKGLKELDTGHFQLAEQNAEAPSGKNEGAAEFDTNSFNLKNLAAEKEALKGKGGKGEGVQVFDTGHFNLKELDAQKEAMKKGGKPGAAKGEGVQVFDTGHFNLKELDAQKEAMKKGAKGGGKGEGVQVFDTGHFNLKELDAQKAAMKKGAKGKGEGVNEFDTGHFRLNDLKKPGGRPAGKEPLDLDLDEVVHKAGISSPNEAPVGKRAPQAQAPNPLPPSRSARATSDGVPRPASARQPTPAPAKPASQPGARSPSQPSAARTPSQPSARPVSQPAARPGLQSSAGRPPSQAASPSAANRPASARQPIDPRFAQPQSAYRRPPAEEESGGSVAIYLIGAVAVLALIGVYMLFK